MENGLIGKRLAVLQGDRREKILSVASNASDGWRTTFTPVSSDQMIRNLSMKIAHSNLAEPESTSPIFMLKFLIIWSLLKGVKVVIHPSLRGNSRQDKGQT